MKARTITIATAALLAAAALALAACGDSGTEVTARESDAAQSAPPPSRLTVRMGEWFFRTDTPRVKAGRVVVTARNVGGVEHELIAVKTDLPPDEMPMTPEGLDVEKAGKLAIGKPHGHSAGGDEGSEGSGDGHMHEHGEEAAEHGEEADEQGHLEAGETRRYVVDLRPGKYVLMCSIPGHYQMGQYVGLTVVR